RPYQRLRRNRGIEPVRPGITLQDHDLTVMVWRHIQTRRHGQHGECFADLRMGTPDTSNTEDGLVRLREQPFVLPLLRRILWVGELVEAVGNDKASVRCEVATFRPELIDGPLVRARPTPPPLNEFGRGGILDKTNDRPSVGDLDVVTRLQIRNTHAEANLD